MKQLTIKEASQITGLPNSTLREMCAKGIIHGAECIGGKIWVLPWEWVKSRGTEIKKPGEGYVPLADVARSTGVSREALTRAAQSGKIVSFSRKINKRTKWYIKVDDPSFPAYIARAKEWTAKLHNRERGN